VDQSTVATLLFEPAARSARGECALCSVDPLIQIDHSSVLTQLASDTVLIVDGVFAFRPEISRYWDFRIWLDVDPETSVRTRYLPAM
jgi:uridine kinase